MKNNLYFDADFNFLLLECEESNFNNIYLIFHTSEAANQTLHITVDGGADQTESLASDTDIYWVLDGVYWAYDGDTTIYLSNDDGDSDPITINFPAAISESAAINKEEGANFIFQPQQQSGGGSADKMGVVYYINGRPYTVGDTQTELGQITFTVGETTTALVACTFLANITGVTDTAVLSVRLRINRSWEEYFTPEQTVANGKYIVTFTFPLPECSPLDANIIEFFASISEGSAYIDQQQIKASVTAASLRSSQEWDGEIIIDEYFEPVLLENMDSVESTDAASVDMQTPTPVVISDIAAQFNIYALPSVSATEEIIFNQVLRQKIIDTNETTTFDPVYVQTNNNKWELRTTYAVNSTSETIDSGYCTKVTPFVTGLTVSEVRFE